MALENLKSIFTEGIREFKPNDLRNVSDLTPLTNNDEIVSPFVSSGPGGNAGLLPFTPGDIESMHFSEGSLFTENLSSFANTFISNRPQDINDSKLANNYNLTIPQTHQFEVNTPAPILDTLLRQPPSFVSNDLTIKFYNQQQFDPRIPKNEGIQINNINTYFGTINTPTDTNQIERFGTNGFVTTDYSTSGQSQGFQGAPPFIPPLSQLGLDLESSDGWGSLYNSDHTPKNVDTNTSTPFQPYIYGGNVNRDNLDIRKGSNLGSSIFSPSRNSNIGGAPNEPYIVSEIGEGGREINKGNRSIPITRATTDTLRISKFLSSPAGVSFMALQNLYSIIPTSVVRGRDTERESVTLNLNTLDDNALYRVPQRFNANYNPFSTETAISPLARNLGQSYPNVLVRRDGDVFGGLLASSTYEVGGGRTGFNFTSAFDNMPSYRINDTFTYGYPQVEESDNLVDTLLNQLSNAASTVISGAEKVTKTTLGDKMTLSPMIKGTSLDVQTNQTLPNEQDVTTGTKTKDGSNQLTYNVESKKEGMPFYFKDLRDNTYIFFRAYLQDIVENVVPTWTPANYIGRSNPVYSYQSAERDIGFTLKLFANTESELEKIYEKLNRLTSLCYPQYVKDERLTINSVNTDPNGINLTPIFQSNRMKPPLVKMRMGELYAGSSAYGGSTQKSRDGLLGFIETINYTIPQEGVWETKEGKRVPKYIMATIAFRVIYSEVPSLKNSQGDDYNFYGYKGK